MKRLKKMYADKTESIIRDIFYTSEIQNITWAFVPSLDNSDVPNTPAANDFNSRLSRADSPNDSSRASAAKLNHESAKASATRLHRRSDSAVIPELVFPESNKIEQNIEEEV